MPAEHILDSRCVRETEQAGAQLAQQLAQRGGGAVVALFGGMGMGKTAFVRGMAAGFGLKAEVSSPTFSLVNEYGGHPPFVHFDMYRVSGWDDLMTTGFFVYLDSGAVIAVEWSERIETALPADSVRVYFERLGDEERRLTFYLPF